MRRQHSSSVCPYYQHLCHPSGYLPDLCHHLRYRLCLLGIVLACRNSRLFLATRPLLLPKLAVAPKVRDENGGRSTLIRRRAAARMSIIGSHIVLVRCQILRHCSFPPLSPSLLRILARSFSQRDYCRECSGAVPGEVLRGSTMWEPKKIYTQKSAESWSRCCKRGKITLRRRAGSMSIHRSSLGA